MNTFDHLLAKKPVDPGNPAQEETLFGHTQRVFEMARLLTGVLEQGLKDTIGLDQATFKQWEKAVWIAAWMHDWGKANDHFQKMIRNSSFKQGVRHETISLIMIAELEPWLKAMWDDLPPWAKCAALYSVSGHHLKFPDPYAEVRTGTMVNILFNGTDRAEAIHINLQARVRVFPEPAPALTDMSFSVEVTASNWLSSSFSTVFK